MTFQAKVKPRKDKKGTYAVTYVPKVEGVHKVSRFFFPKKMYSTVQGYRQIAKHFGPAHPRLPSQVKVLFAGQDIDKSPYTVNVAKDMGDPSKVHARGPGLEATGNVANKPTYFDIYTAGEEQKLGHSTFRRKKFTSTPLSWVQPVDQLHGNEKSPAFTSHVCSIYQIKFWKSLKPSFGNSL